MSLPKYVPVMKGNPTAFTCLGNWYDLADRESIESMFKILNDDVCSKRDRDTGFKEFMDAMYSQTNFTN